jgi:hypothetical protein
MFDMVFASSTAAGGWFLLIAVQQSLQGVLRSDASDDFKLQRKHATT